MTPHNTNDNQKLPGQYIITDFNGDGVIDTNDSAPYGYTGTPQNTYNATIGIDYKGFSIYAQFYGVTNVSRYVAFNSLPKSFLHTVFKEGAYWSPSTPDGIPSLRMNSTPSYYEGYPLPLRWLILPLEEPGGGLYLERWMDQESRSLDVEGLCKW